MLLLHEILHMQYPNISHHYIYLETILSFQLYLFHLKKKKKKKLYLLVDMENYFATVASPEITSSNISFVDPHLQTMFHVKYNGDSR